MPKECFVPNCLFHDTSARAKAFPKPFYWTKVHDDPKISAPSGWYQWTKDGLVYLGESILGDQDARFNH